MASQEIRDASQGHAGLSKTELIAILATISSLILGLLVGLCTLLIRAIRTHKRLLADLEERGIAVTHLLPDGTDPPVVARPRAVLRRTTLLPFNSKSGWGSLPSHENMVPPPTQLLPPHRTETQTVASCRRMSQLPWPFSGRRTSGGALHLKKLRPPQLTAINETSRGICKTSPVKSIPTGPAAEEPTLVKNKHSSDQSLLKHHPALRNGSPESTEEAISVSKPEPLLDELVCKRRSNGQAKYSRSNRSKSVAVIPVNALPQRSAHLSRSKMHSRSVSLCSQSSGYAPDAAVPPLPLSVARAKSVATRRSMLARSPSRHSVSSFDSVGSSILASQSSPGILRPNSLRPGGTTKEDWGNLPVIRSGAIRGQVALDQHDDQPDGGSTKSNTDCYGIGAPSTKRYSRRESHNSSLYGPGVCSASKMRTAETVRLSRISTSSPAGSALIVQTMTTPRRQSGTKVGLNGSPQERRKTSVLRDVSGNQNFPSRQLSQTSTQASSTRSSNGNPFQWDPTPLQSGKPSALKGSPSARKGHKRQNCVRISLAPTILGPPSRSPSPSVMNDIQEESPDTSAQKLPSATTGLGFSSTRSLPRPPTSSIFAPEVKLNPTTLRVSQTPNFPTLSFQRAQHDVDGSPTLGRYDSLNRTSLPCDSKRLSNNSIFSIPTFPNPYSDIGSIRSIASPPPAFAFSRPSSEYVEETRTPQSSATLSPHSRQSEVTAVDGGFNLMAPQVIYPAPTTGLSSLLSSPFTTTPTNFSAFPHRDKAYTQSPPYSPPCSPKDLRPRSFQPVSPIRPSSPALGTATIASTRGSPGDTIDPAMLTMNTFNSSNGPIHDSITIPSSNCRETNPSVPLTTVIASTLFEPLIEAAFPSQTRALSTVPKPFSYQLPASSESSRVRTHTRSKSAYQPLKSHPPVQKNADIQSTLSSPLTHTPLLFTGPSDPHSPFPAPIFSSPSANALSVFSDIPALSPTPMGPRASPPRDLRRTIAALRRMNSDIKGDNKGDRRYLRLGREASLALLGEESWTSFAESAVEDEVRTFTNLDDWEGESEKALASDLTPKNGQERQGAGSAGRDEYDSEGASNLSQPTSLSDAEGRSSSVWEDGEKFWASTPSPPPLSPTGTPMAANKALGTSISSSLDTGKAARGSKGADSVGRDPRRNALAFSINVQPPSTQGTPGSLYDTDGFLRG
ncbi:hypothetical protein AOQ84DRAFT_413885 [Glonium stellatum]|uniref:Uncharacterized protein n=1 Tax=Glonium stellatum TaxID=574774 RepID=A0A8E2EVB1_9PEZI|nr:hypothetical protein AOQ84DRAFT_413885 [Glonium stellatum]